MTRIGKVDLVKQLTKKGSMSDQDASEEEGPLIQTSFSMVLVTQILKALKFHTSAVCLPSKEGERPILSWSQILSCLSAAQHNTMITNH